MIKLSPIDKEVSLIIISKLLLVGVPLIALIFFYMVAG